MQLLITGAGGFIGRSLCSRIISEGWGIRGTLLANESPAILLPGVEPVIVEPFGDNTPLAHAVKEVDTVIHLAARVHIMHDTAKDQLLEYRRINLHGTECLARQAAQAGVKRFVFMSTIGVNGNTSGSRAFSDGDDPSPHNPYSISKLEAEISLREISAKTGMAVVIVRAPLVYGPGNPGNFLSLLRIIAKGIPLPFASVSNQKSFLYVENLADALSRCAIHPSAAGQTFLVSDGEDISTPELIRRLASAVGRPARLFPFPTGLMRFAGRMLGKSSAVERLAGSLQVDSSKIQRKLDWVPPFTMEEGLKETANWFKDAHKSSFGF